MCCGAGWVGVAWAAYLGDTEMVGATAVIGWVEVGSSSGRRRLQGGSSVNVYSLLATVRFSIWMKDLCNSHEHAQEAQE